MDAVASGFSLIVNEPISDTLSRNNSPSQQTRRVAPASRRRPDCRMLREHRIRWSAGHPDRRPERLSRIDLPGRYWTASFDKPLRFNLQMEQFMSLVFQTVRARHAASPVGTCDTKATPGHTARGAANRFSHRLPPPQISTDSDSSIILLRKDSHATQPHPYQQLIAEYPRIVHLLSIRRYLL
jgi:hypothetical protein